jgi:hypothetical protein
MRYLFGRWPNFKILSAQSLRTLRLRGEWFRNAITAEAELAEEAQRISRAVTAELSGCPTTKLARAGWFRQMAGETAPKKLWYKAA